MIKYLATINVTLIKNLVYETVRTVGYKFETDRSDQQGFINRKLNSINQTLSQISIKQLNSSTNPIINYSNYRKLFNKTLIEYYKEQVC